MDKKFLLTEGGVTKLWFHYAPPFEMMCVSKLMMAITYDDGTHPWENLNQGIAAIDMGEIHGIAAVADTGEALIVTSRKLRSVKRLRNKKFKELYKKRSRCKKGSRK